MPNSRTPRIARRIIRSLFLLLILAVNVLLIWRMCSTGIPDGIRNLTLTPTLTEAYRESGKDLTFRYQEQNSITRAENNAGYFSVESAVFIPEAHQVQIVFRYNNSTLRHLMEDYGLEELPDKAETWFDVTVAATTDRTPDNREDNQDPEQLLLTRYHATSFTRETTTLYTYYRYVFDGVDVEPDTVGVFVDVYYKEDIDYERNAYGTLCIYDDESEWKSYRLTSADKKNLEAAAQKGNEEQ